MACTRGSFKGPRKFILTGIGAEPKGQLCDSSARRIRDYRLDFPIEMTRISRRGMIQQVVSKLASSSLAAAPFLASAEELQTSKRKGRIRQSVSRWCYEKIPLEELCEKGAAM